MDKHMTADLDRHITGNYGEDQFKNDPYHKYKNHQLNWRIGDLWHCGPDTYILCMTNDPVRKDRLYVQFVSIETGCRYTDKVFVPDRKKWEALTVPIGEICKLIYERDISISTTDDDYVRLEDLEKAHEYGYEWEQQRAPSSEGVMHGTVPSPCK